MTNWADRKKDFNGCGLPVVTLPDGSQLAESVPTSIYYGKKFGYFLRTAAQVARVTLLSLAALVALSQYMLPTQKSTTVNVSPQRNLEFLRVGSNFAIKASAFSLIDEAILLLSSIKKLFITYHLELFAVIGGLSF